MSHENLTTLLSLSITFERIKKQAAKDKKLCRANREKIKKVIAKYKTIVQP